MIWSLQCVNPCLPPFQMEKKVVNNGNFPPNISLDPGDLDWDSSLEPSLNWWLNPPGNSTSPNQHLILVWTQDYRGKPEEQQYLVDLSRALAAQELAYIIGLFQNFAISNFQRFSCHLGSLLGWKSFCLSTWHVTWHGSVTSWHGTMRDITFSDWLVSKWYSYW